MRLGDAGVIIDRGTVKSTPIPAALLKAIFALRKRLCWIYDNLHINSLFKRTFLLDLGNGILEQSSTNVRRN
jgi:hypothetical protein